jgi:hypothetical protein
MYVLKMEFLTKIYVTLLIFMGGYCPVLYIELAAKEALLKLNDMDNKLKPFNKEVWIAASRKRDLFAKKWVKNLAWGFFICGFFLSVSYGANG